MVSVADFVPPLAVALMVAVVFAVTAVVEMVKFTLVAPAGTVTRAGTTAEPLLLERDTTNPLEGAGLVRVTVPVELFPPKTEVGFRLTVFGVAAFT